MLDIRKIRTEPEAVKAALAKRGEVAKIDELLALDTERRKVLTETETLKAQSNALGPQIAALKKSGGDASELLTLSTDLKRRIQVSEQVQRELDEKQVALVTQLPNLPLDDVQAGGENDAVEVQGASRPLRNFDFEPKAHWDLSVAQGLVDYERGTKLSGSGFVLYTGRGAKLQRALISFMLDTHIEQHGYTELGVPYMLSRESITASGHIVKFAPEMYHDEESDLFCVPTAEPALVNIHRGEIIEPGQLPYKYVAHTPCWRREAGAAGKDTRGLQRVHQFDKVELFRYELPENSEHAVHEMTKEACVILDLLEIPYRILRLAAGDMSFAAAVTYDIEIWAPGVGKWLEVSSASNCTDFQSRRADIRFRREPGAKPEFPHLLNASGLALARTYATLLETHQNADGTITIPSALRPYMGRLERIG
jgi:seryl-tRNA synthetase